MSSSSVPSKTRILFLSANPADTTQMKLDKEVEIIDDQLQSVDFRDRFELFKHGAVSEENLTKYMWRHRPHIVHFSGHASQQGEVLFEAQDGSSQPVQAEKLGQWFKGFREDLRCVVLNACWSATQAQAICAEIDSVIGMTRPVADDDSIVFSREFYRALGSGQGLQEAFEHAKVAMQDSSVAQMLMKPGTDVGQLFRYDLPSAVPPGLDSTLEAEKGLVFISYAHEDHDFVQRLIADLEDGQIRGWVDHRDLKPGMLDWEEAVRSTIRKSRAVLLIVSPNVLRSKYVLGEMAVAEMYKRPVIPIWASGEYWIECVPLEKVDMQYLDMRGLEYDSALSRLCETLRAIKPPQASVPASPPVETLSKSLQPFVASVMRSAEPALPPDFEPRNPYKGLRSFESKDHEDFCGRDELVGSLFEHVENLPKNARLLAVVGPSGAGKSSVVKAGLLPKLQEAHKDWSYLGPIRPGQHPLEALAGAFSRKLEGRSTKSILDDFDLPSGPSLHELTESVCAPDAPGARVVLFIDQFEELFSLTHDETERRKFIDLLTNAAVEPDGRVIVLLTLRGDYYDRPMNYAQLGDLIQKNNQSVLPMSLVDLKEVIEKPASKPDVQLRFDEGLVGEFVFQMRGQVGALPLLQFALDKLFQKREGLRLTWNAYDAIGGVRGALAQHAEDVYAQLPSDEHRFLARWLFLRLLIPGNTERKTSRRQVRISELTRANQDETAIVKGLIETFVEERLLVTSAGEAEPPEPDKAESTVEVAHEALLGEWDRLKTWVKESFTDIVLQNNLAQDAQEWEVRGKNAAYLYRGSRLADALAWKNRSKAASLLEEQFLDASDAAKKDEDRREDARRKQEKQWAQTIETRGRVARLAILAAVALALVVPVFFMQARDADTRSATAAAQLAVAAVTMTQTTKDVQTEVLTNHAIDLLGSDNGNLELATLLLLHAPSHTNLVTRILERTVDQLYTIESLTLAPFHQRAITSIAVAPDGTYFVSASNDGSVQKWDARTGKHLDTYYDKNYEGEVYDVAISPDGKFLLTAHVNLPGKTRGALIRDMITKTPMTECGGHDAEVRSVAFSPDGHHLATGAGANDRHVRLFTFDGVTGCTLERTFDRQDGAVLDVAFSPDGRYIASGGEDKQVRLWNVETGQVQTLGAHFETINSVVFSPDGKFLLSGGRDRMARLWDVATGQEVRQFIGHIYGVYGIAFSPDGQYILTGSADYTARLWDVQTGRELRRFTGGLNTVNAVAFLNEGKTAVTGNADVTLRIWDADLEHPTHFVLPNNGTIYSVAVSPDGQTAAIGATKFDVYLWDPGHRTVRQLTGHTGAIWSTTFSPDGKYVLTGSADHTARLWEVATGKEVRRFGPGGATIYSAAFTTDGKLVVTGDGLGMVRLWEVASQELELSVSTAPVLSLAISPDNKYILTGSTNGEATLWDRSTGVPIRSFVHGVQGDYVWSVAFSPDGLSIVTAGGNREVKVWTFDGQQEPQSYKPGFAVFSLAFSPDSKRLVIGTADSAVQLVDVQTMTPIRYFGLHRGSVRSVAFSPDGLSIFTGSADGTVRQSMIDLWAFACTRVFRELAPGERADYGIGKDEIACPALVDLPMPTPEVSPFPTRTLPVWTPLPTLAWTPTSTVTPMPSLESTAPATP